MNKSWVTLALFFSGSCFLLGVYVGATSNGHSREERAYIMADASSRAASARCDDALTEAKKLVGEMIKQRKEACQ